MTARYQFRRSIGSSCRSGGRTAFTLIEMLTVIGIIAMLTAIVVIAFRMVGNNIAERSTRTALETCKTFQSRYESVNSLPLSLKASSSSAISLDSNASGSIGPTAEMATLMRSMPDTAAAEDKMPGTSLEQLSWAPLSYSNSTIYYKGDYALDGTWYQAMHDVAAGSGNPSASPANWVKVAVPVSIPVPVDGWGHGMRFIPGRLTNVETGPKPNNVARADVTNNGRPFWVSAGPDGLFTTHDDNVYSFEN